MLAITAFMVQMVVSAQQHAVSRAATTESQRLNFETNKALEQIKANAAANQEILARQFDTLLDALVRGRAPEAKQRVAEGPDTGEEDVDDDIGIMLGPSQRLLEPFAFTGASAEDQRIIRELESWPTDERRGVEALETLNRLSPHTIASLERFRRDELASRRAGGEVGLNLPTTEILQRAHEELLREGLVEGPGPDERYRRLTDWGRQVARLLRADGDPPAFLADRLGIRGEAAEAREAPQR